MVARLGRHRRGRSLGLASVLLPALVMVFARTTTMATACVLLVGIGLMLLVVQSLAITLVQVNTPNRIRGRVMSIYSMTHAGADTASNAAVGWLAQRVGLPAALTRERRGRTAFRRLAGCVSTVSQAAGLIVGQFYVAPSTSNRFPSDPCPI